MATKFMNTLKNTQVSSSCVCVRAWVDERHILSTFPNPEFLALFRLVVEGEVKGGALCDRGGGASAGHGTGGDTAVLKTKSQHPIRLKHADVLIIWLLVSDHFFKSDCGVHIQIWSAIPHSLHTFWLGGRRDVSEPEEDRGRWGL